MLSRSIAILFASYLPTAALILPLSPAHKINALVAGTLATILAAFSMVYDRARIGAVVIGAWVALTPFIFSSTLVEEALTVCWGTMMFVCLGGPFSAAPGAQLGGFAAAGARTHARADGRTATPNRRLTSLPISRVERLGIPAAMTGSHGLIHQEPWARRSIGWHRPPTIRAGVGAGSAPVAAAA